MSAQESLTFLFDAMAAPAVLGIALGFIAIATIDLSQEIIQLYQQVFITPQQPPLTNSQALPQLPDPWLLPIEDTVVDLTNRDIPEQPKPVLLLAQAKAIVEETSYSVVEAQSLGQQETTLEELLVGIDLDRLQLRRARRLAKLLGIAQKINGRDQKLDWLRRQIKAQLQQAQLLQPEV